MTEYDVDYFIAKFEAIPAESWCMGVYQMGMQHCVFGHCGVEMTAPTREGDSLYRLFGYSKAVMVNDDVDNYSELGDDPRERILNALYLIKAGAWEDATCMT